LALIIWFFVSISKSQNKSNNLKAQFVNNGYKFFYIGYGSNYLAIDDANRKIKIGNKDNDFQMDLKFSDIIEYKYQWKNDNISPYNTNKSDNEFVFLIRNPDYPMHTIRYGSAFKWAEREYAQLRVVLSS
jgi:hypothetical protein